MELDQAGGVERRENPVLAGLVEDCLTLLRTSGEDAARECLVARQVPEHIVLRVLACAAFRRQACNKKSPNGFARLSSSHRENPSERA